MANSNDLNGSFVQCPLMKTNSPSRYSKMHCLQNKPSSSSSSCDASPSSSPKSSSVDSTAEYSIGDINFFSKSCGLRSQPCLSRQRKLRYLSDREVGISWNNELKEYVMMKSMSFDPSTARFSSVVPHPLPLPERRESWLSSSGNCPLPWPKKGAASRGDAEEGNKTNSCIGDESGDADNTDFSFGSKVACQTIGKITEHIDTCSAKSPHDHGMKVFQDPNVNERVKKNFRLNVPVTGALTSGFSGLDMPACSSSHVSPQKSISSPNCPLLQSPRFKNRNSKSLSATTPKLHHNLSPESSMTWHEHNGHARVRQLLASVHELPLLPPVHPLPLPPGAAPSSQYTYDHRSYYKLEASSMTSQWQKRKLIGRGTFGSVYLAINRETGAFCAMKEVDLIPDDPKSAECIRQLEQEIKVLSQLKHPNIVQYYGSEVVDDHLYIYLEYVHPGSINKYIREHCGAMTESVVRNFTRHILSGLAYLHSTRTIHRDIKGANLLVDASGIVKVADFGMAKHLTGQAAELSLRGSPYWMAPEVIESVMQKSSSSDVALAVDIWSLGCTVIEMLNGKPPWSELEWPAAMFRVLTENPPIPENLSSEGKDFLWYCFRRNPTERPSASQLLDHPFLRSSHHLDFPGCSRAFSAMKLADKHIFQESASTLQCQSLQAPNSLI